MKIYKFTDADYIAVVDALVNRANVNFMSHDETVRNILQDVRQKGDSALLEYTHRFDQHDLPMDRLQVTPEEIQQAYSQVKPEQIDALRLAAKNIRAFHQRQVQSSWEYREDDVLLGQIIRPLEIVGIYVTGGKASYP